MRPEEATLFSTVHSHEREQRTPLLPRPTPGGRQIVAVEAYCLLHLFMTGSSPPPGATGLSREEIDQLRPRVRAGVSTDRSTATWQDTDWPLVQALADDGRAPYRQLAALTHWHESIVRRRVEELTASGVLLFDLDVALEALGIHSHALVWMSVVPSKLAEVGRALARRPEIPFVAATTGPTNLVASLTGSDDRSLYEYRTGEIAALDGLTHMETARVVERSRCTPR